MRFLYSNLWEPQRQARPSLFTRHEVLHISNHWLKLGSIASSDHQCLLPASHAAAKYRSCPERESDTSRRPIRSAWRSRYLVPSFAQVRMARHLVTPAPVFRASSLPPSLCCMAKPLFLIHARRRKQVLGFVAIPSLSMIWSLG